VKGTGGFPFRDFSHLDSSIHTCIIYPHASETAHLTDSSSP
jgi:hypothetical protein